MLLASCAHDDGIIRTPTPARPAGQEDRQEDMIQFRAEPIENVGVGIVGVGDRGSGAVDRLTYVPGCHIAAVCDIEPDRVQKNIDLLASRGQIATPYSGSDEAYKQLCEDPAVDLVYICTDWLHHVPIALYAMEHGKHVAIEVPSAETLQACWDLVNTSERTRQHCIILENCLSTPRVPTIITSILSGTDTGTTGASISTRPIAATSTLPTASVLSARLLTFTAATA